MIEILLATGGSKGSATFTIVPNSTFINGGDQVEFSIYPEGSMDGYDYYWALEGGDLSIVDSPTSGFVSFIGDGAETILVESINDEFLDGNKEIRLVIKSDATTTDYLDVSPDVAFVYTKHPMDRRPFVDPGVHEWVVPTGVEYVNVVCVGAGQGSDGVPRGEGGTGGDLRWRNTVQVVEGETLIVEVGAGGVNNTSGSVRRGGNSSLKRGESVLLRAAGGGNFGNTSLSTENVGGGIGGLGAKGGEHGPGGGGGAAGYSGDGGDGGNLINSANAGEGGGAGGGAHYYTEMNDSHHATPGGGVGIFGQGPNGGAGTKDDPQLGGGGGSNGVTGTWFVEGNYGGGGRGQSSNNNFGAVNGAPGAVHIIWGPGREFPTAGDVNPYAAPVSGGTTGGTTSGGGTSGSGT